MSASSSPIKAFSLWICLGVLGLMTGQAALANTLDEVRFAELPGERFEVRMNFSGQPPEPAGYTIEKPARIVLDFPDVANALTQKRFPLSFGNAKSAMVLSGNGRTRMILNLTELTTYQTRVEGNAFVVEVGSAQVADYIKKGASVTASISSDVDHSAGTISNIDFRRGEEGEGKVILTLPDPGVNIDATESGRGIRLTINGASLPQELRRRLDVTDFATPVTNVDADYDGSRVVIDIGAEGDYDYLAYQADNEYVLSVKPITEQELEEKKARFAFSGDKLSLNFQNIEVRSVLQIIADFTELNLVASDTVSGRITLRLDNVPWDQALDLVLKTKGLDKRQVGNVLMVAPAAEIAERERQEIETRKQLQELAPLRTEYIRVRYANAQELFELFEDDEGGGDGGSTSSILSERGQAIVDERTNSIILTDTQEKIEEFRLLIEKIDIPIQQVMIEARIVIANTDYQKEMGVSWTSVSTLDKRSPRHSFLVAGRDEAFAADNFEEENGVVQWTPTIPQATLVDLGVASPSGSLAVMLQSDNGSLALELSALEDSGYAEIVAQPKVITGDKQTAHIESGKEIPYQEASASGATSTSFKEAVLKLEVTPQITPDDRIIMDLKINQDSIGDVDSASEIPIIDVTQLETQVLVGNGQTVVLGGIFQDEVVTGETKVPFLGDIPYLGRLFSKDIQRNNKRELLIFITPKILAQSLAN